MLYALDKSEIVSINSTKYYLRIRTCNTDNPVVLFLHGGCGSPDRAQVMKYQSPLATNFTLVAFDQRGSGYAYNKKEAKTLDLTKEIYVNDVHNVVDYLKQKFNKQKLIIVGHSFGSVLGVWYVQQYPNDVLAYVGVGQCVDYIENEKLSYAWTLQEAEKVGDNKSVAILKRIGAPLDNGKYKNEHQKSLMKQRAVLHKLGGATYSNRKPYWQELLFHEVPIMLKEYSFCGMIKYVKGLSYSPNTTLAKTNPDFMNTAKKLDVPVYLLLGHHDMNCVYTLAEKWFEQLEAPDKKIVWFESSAHSPQWEESDKWNDKFNELFC